MSEPLRVVVDARLPGGISGGIETVICGFAGGLSRLDDGPEEYLFWTLPGEDEWLRPHLSGPSQVVHADPGPYARSHRPDGSLSLLDTAHPAVPRSDGTVERLGADVVHFTWQAAFLTDVPSIYHPHDLQHLHLREFFTDEQIAMREILYPTYCAQADVVATASTWVKRDLVDHYRLPEEKIAVVPLAPILELRREPTDDEVAEISARYELPETFVFYPAQTWPHKNHLALLRALARLRDGGLNVPLVCSGHLNDHFPTIQAAVAELGLEEQVRFLGFVDPLELHALYKLCRGVVVPTKFEAASGPVYEAFLAGSPTACSNVTSLPEQAADAALLFDPDDVDEMAETIKRLWTDAELRETLSRRARARIGNFSWSRACKTFRALYRQTAGRPLTEEDDALLAAPPQI